MYIYVYISIETVATSTNYSQYINSPILKDFRKPNDLQ